MLRYVSKTNTRRRNISPETKMKHKILLTLKLSFLFSVVFLAIDTPLAKESNTDQPYYFDKQPYIHPKIVQALATWLSDGGDQIVSINLLESQGSNRFCCKSDIKVSTPVVSFSEDGEQFGYSYIGITESGVHLLYTYSSGGGSGVFKHIMLVTMETDYGVEFDEKHSVIKATNQRLLLKKLGEVVLGDRWSGELEIVGNDLIIGEDRGWYAGSNYGGPFTSKRGNTVIKIDISH